MSALMISQAKGCRLFLRNARSPAMKNTTVRNTSKLGNISLHVVSENRHHDVLDHVTKIFLRDEPLAQCFPPCTTGQREREFREYATMQLRSGFCVMALDGSTVVGACLNRPFARDEVMLSSLPSSVGPDEDPLIGNVVRMIITVHRKLDLFKAFGLDTIFEVGLLSVEPTHTGRGLAEQIMRKSLEVGALQGFKVAKGDCTGAASTRVCQRAGMVAVHKMLYDEYRLDNKVVFQNTPTRGPALTVMAARLQDKQPHVQPLAEMSKL